MQVRIRRCWRDSIMARHRVVHNETVYAIAAPPNNVGTRYREMHLQWRAGTYGEGT